jgi:ribonuclease VapC
LIVDASALLAILRGEPDAARFERAIADAASRRISAANWLEAAIVVDGSGDPVLSRRFDELCRVAQLVVEPVTPEQARIARDAYRDFGRGSGHPAGSTSATAAPTASPRSPASRCCSRAGTSCTRT